MRKSHKQKVADRKAWKKWDRFYRLAEEEICKAIDEDFLLNYIEQLKNENSNTEK